MWPMGAGAACNLVFHVASVRAARRSDGVKAVCCSTGYCVCFRQETTLFYSHRMQGTGGWLGGGIASIAARPQAVVMLCFDAGMDPKCRLNSSRYKPPSQGQLFACTEQYTSMSC
jgi:hypothetical protein